MLQFRTPNDHISFGAALGDVNLRSPDCAYIRFSSFIVEKQSPLRLPRLNAEALEEQLGALRVAGEWRSVTHAYLKSPEAMQAAQSLHMILASIKSSDGWSGRSLTEEWADFTAGLSGVRLTEGDPLPKTTSMKDIASSLTDQAEQDYSFIHGKRLSDDGYLLCDDTSILWMAYEAFRHPRIAYYCNTGFLFPILRHELVQLETKVALAQALGELGCPIWAVADDPLPGPDGKFLEAILHSRWQWVPTEDELAVCREKLTHPWASELEKFAAVDCLLRWGLIDDAPADLLNDWFADQLRASEARRHATWKALTRTQSGRKFLNARFDQLAAHPEVQQLVAQMFRCRAEATLALKRYDFMTEEECQQTLARWRPVCGETEQKQ